MKNPVKRNLIILNKAFKKFLKDNPVEKAAALSFISLFAVPPILIITIYCIGLFTGNEIASNQISNNLSGIFGQKIAGMIMNIIDNYDNKSQNIIRTALGVLFFIIASSSIFALIQRSLNNIWGIKPTPTLMITIWDRVVSFLFILSLSILISISLAIDTMMPVIKGYLAEYFKTGTYLVINAVKFLFVFFSTTLGFSLVFVFLPDARVKYCIAWRGALFTAVLFAIGKGLITWSLVSFGIDTMYGATGTSVMFLLWIFYSALIFYYGAEVTEQIAVHKGMEIIPRKHAVKVELSIVE
jgi:membrane protein